MMIYVCKNTAVILILSSFIEKQKAKIVDEHVF